ncbi:ABC transporter substrate-binding protein [Microbacterium sp. NPDC079995]|uniref:ABC transporter substrate-binding protein n=1 Tax=unclassified Microbacterium TaxID=2609290 RepID=UPI00344D4244
MFLSSTSRRARAGRAAATLAAATGLLLSVSACQAGDRRDEGGITVSTGIIGDITRNFNPFSPSVLQPTLGVIYEPLFFYNPLSTTGEPVPMLGTEFSWNEDGTELTIAVRDGVTFTDGEPLTAADVEYTFDLLADTPEINAIGYTGDATATDDSTVVVTFPESSLPLGPDLLGRTSILPEHIWGEIDDVVNTINEDPVGTGPFKLKTFTPQSFVLEANSDYWQDGKPGLQTLRFVSFASGDSATTALLDGQLDWNTGQLPDFDDDVEADPDLNQIDTPVNQTAFIACADADRGCTGPQTDPAVRLAINYGIDRDEIIDIAFEGKGGAVSPALLLVDSQADQIAPDLPEETPANADQARATEILEAAGWERGSDGFYAKDGERLSVKVQVPQEWTSYITAIQIAQQQLAEVGIDLSAEQLPGNQYSENRFTGDFQFTMDGVYQGPAPDPYYVYNTYLTSAGTADVGETANSNYSRFSDPEVDELVEKARVSLDDAEKTAIYARIQTIAASAMPYIPVLVVPTVTYYRTEDAVGWPEEGNLYAFPASWSVWNMGVVAANLTPAQ